MKHHHLKAYGLAMIGVFNVYAPFLSGKFVEMVVALPTIGGITDSKKTGLAVTMSPPLEFTADGLLRNPQSAVVDYYDMKLALLDHRDRSNPDPVRKPKKSALHPINADKVCYGKTRLNDFDYCTGWMLTWDYLVKLTETGKLYHFPTTSMDVDFYMSEYSGFYFIETLKSPGHYLHLIQYKEQSPTMEIKASEFSFEVPNLVFFERPHNGQIVKLRLGNEATKVPPAIFNEIGRMIPSFTIGSDGRYHGPCTEIIKDGEPTFLLDLIIKFESEERESSVGICAYHLIDKKSHGTTECTLLIEDSHEQNVWALGYSFLKAYAVSIDTADAHDKSQLIKFYYKNILKIWHFDP